MSDIDSVFVRSAAADWPTGSVAEPSAVARYPWAHFSTSWRLSLEPMFPDPQRGSSS
jgi:hypothetical protein